MARLSRAEQDAVLVPVVIAARCELSDPFSDGWASDHTLHSFRAALRLDDDKLDKIIADHPEGISWTRSGSPQ